MEFSASCYFGGILQTWTSTSCLATSIGRRTSLKLKCHRYLESLVGGRADGFLVLHAFEEELVGHHVVPHQGPDAPVLPCCQQAVAWITFDAPLTSLKANVGVVVHSVDQVLRGHPLHV